MTKKTESHPHFLHTDGSIFSTEGCNHGSIFSTATTPKYGTILYISGGTLKKTSAKQVHAGPAEVLPFPPSRRPAKVLDVAHKLAKCRTRRHRGYYLEQTRETVIGVLVRRGVAQELATKEAARFIQAVLAESAKLQRAGGAA